jgi:hypothetical protein
MDLIVNSQTARVARAGYANVALPLTVIAAILAHLASRDLGSPVVGSVGAVAAVTVLCFWMYTRAVARLSLKEGMLSLTCSVHTVRILLADVRCVGLACVPASMLGVITVRRNGRVFPQLFYYVAPVTSWGDVRHTLARLGDSLRASAVSVTQSKTCVP